MIEKEIYLPCGGVAIFDHGSGCSHRCIDCLATVGSVGMPRDCRAEMEKYEAWEKLGGAGWDYNTGKTKVTN